MSYHRVPGYGLGKFLIDLTLTLVTAGFWLVIIFIREMRHLARSR